MHLKAALLSIPLSALVLSDGRPGHFNLADGIVAAAGRLRPLAVTRIEVRRGHWPGDVVAAWSNAGVAPARLLRTVYGLDAAHPKPASLVVSAGAETLGANIACARLLGAANVFYGSLRRFRPDGFSLTLTSYPAFGQRLRHAFALKPSPSAATARLQRAGRPASPPRTLALLVGGPSGESDYGGDDWASMLQLIEAVAAGGLRWLVSNSRRTPAALSDRLADLSRGTSPAIAQFSDTRRTTSASLAGILAAADAAVVTDESSSMVSDAVAAGLPVVGIAPKHHRLTANERDYRAHLMAKRWYRALPLDGLTPARLLGAHAELLPLAEDPVGPLAALPAERLPHLFAAADQAVTVRPPGQPSRPA